MEPQRLSKIMASRGLCSRREADHYIEQGLVRVDGKVVAELGTKVRPDAGIELAAAAQRQQGERVTILLNKPIGLVSGQPEKGYAPAVSIVTAKTRWSGDTSPRRFAPEQVRGMAPAGRLDIDSTGLLVLTQDGRIARQIIGEQSSVDKEYLVRVKGSLSDRGMTLLRHGLSLDGKKLKPAQVNWQNRDQLRFVLREGRKRQIRRMCEQVGLKVVGLKRVRIGTIALGRLHTGRWRYLHHHEPFLAPNPEVDAR